MKTIFDPITVHAHAFHVYHAYHVFVVHPGSLPFAVKTIFVHSFPDKFKLLAVGARLFRVYVAYHVLSFHRLSLTLARIHVVVGSFCAAILYVAIHVHVHRFVQFVLNAYAVACNHVQAQSLADVIVNEPATASFHELFANVNVGAVVSILIVLHVIAENHRRSVT